MKMRYTFTLLQTHYETLRRELIQSDGKEHTAFILCGRAFVPSDPWDGTSKERFLSQEVISLPRSEIITSGLLSTTWKTAFFVTVLKRAEGKNLAVAVVHSHPEGITAFSPVDDMYEPDLFRLAFNRNGGDKCHASLIMTPDGNLSGRAWDSRLNHYPIDIIRTIGKRFRLFYAERGLGLSAEAFNRQELAFGKALNQDFAKLRIAVVGCGGTGSAVAMFLARLGVGQLLLTDKDTVEMTNLNRLHGASIADAENKKPKVDVMAAAIAQMGLGTRVKAITEWVESEKTANFLKACDFIFGCTDDHRGRLFLNRMAHFYLLPLIDMGLMIQVSKSDSPEIAVLDGRVTVDFKNRFSLSAHGAPFYLANHRL
jgi:hypothetical protein